MAPSLASVSASSSARTRSAVERRRFSSFGSSQRKSALSRTSWAREKHNQTKHNPAVETVRCYIHWTGIHVSHILQICKWGYYNTSKNCNCSQGEEQELTYLTNLFVNFCKLFQVVLEKGDLLFLCWTPTALIRLQLRALKHAQIQLHIKHS